LLWLFFTESWVFARGHDPPTYGLPGRGITDMNAITPSLLVEIGSHSLFAYAGLKPQASQLPPPK
jgi:hypothetical protein